MLVLWSGQAVDMDQRAGDAGLLDQVVSRCPWIAPTS